MSDFTQALTDRRTQLGICAMYPCAGIIERIGGDWDFIWIDGQHGELGYQDILALVRAADLVGAASLVRVAWLDAGAIGKALDTNAAGVIVPCIDTVEQAQAAVAAAKFPPLGRRSFGARRPIDFIGRTYSDHANDTQQLIVQIESPAALEVADDIAALPGVDALMFGPDDVALRRGRSMTQPHDPDVLREDLKTVADACKRHGKLAMSVAANDPMLKLHLELGFHLLVCGGDVPFLANGSKAASQQSCAILDQTTQDNPGAVSASY